MADGAWSLGQANNNQVLYVRMARSTAGRRRYFCFLGGGIYRMATKTTNGAEVTENREESGDGPLMDGMAQAVKKMIARGKERGYVTYDEMNAALPPDQSSSEQIEDTMAMLSEMGINVVESEEQDETRTPPPKAMGKTRVSGNLDDDDIGRTDDPVRMYLREMGRWNCCPARAKSPSPSGSKPAASR